MRIYSAQWRPVASCSRAGGGQVPAVLINGGYVRDLLLGLDPDDLDCAPPPLATTEPEPLFLDQTSVGFTYEGAQGRV